MEIERKFLISSVPDGIRQYPHDMISQAYISTDPVIRIRQKNDQYILTVKSFGLMAREEAEFSISGSGFDHLMTKAEGMVIQKTRYRIPEKDCLLIELDFFHGDLEGLVMAEVEFPDLKTAEDYIPPEWFGPEVTSDFRFQNSSLSHLNPEDIRDFLGSLDGVCNLIDS